MSDRELLQALKEALAELEQKVEDDAAQLKRAYERIDQLTAELAIAKQDIADSSEMMARR